MGKIFRDQWKLILAVILLIGLVLSYSKAFTAYISRKIDSVAIQRVENRNLIASPSPIVAIDPSLNEKIDNLSKEVDSLK